MSDLMFHAVLTMPYDMAMSDELSRRQFYDRVQEAVQRVVIAENRVAELEAQLATPAPTAPSDLAKRLRSHADGLQHGAVENVDGAIGAMHEAIEHIEQLEMQLARPAPTAPEGDDTCSRCGGADFMTCGCTPEQQLLR